MKKILLLFVTFLLTMFYVYSQEFSCPQVDCKGQCGAFTDANHDGFCDHGQLSEKVKAAQRRLKEKQDSINKAAAAKQDSKTVKKNDVIVKEENSVGKVEDTASSEDISSSVAEEKPDDTAEILQIPEQPAKIAPKYHLISITIPLLILYILSLILVKKNVITKNLNRKIWNIALTGSFLVSGILGMVLVFWLNYGYHPGCYLTVKVLHVEFGIAMAAISIFHILWHLSYYKSIFKK